MEVMFKYLLCRQACAYLSEEVYLRMKIFYPTLSIPLYAPSTQNTILSKKKKQTAECHWFFSILNFGYFVRKHVVVVHLYRF